jgi:hypothetical protein
LSGLANQKNFDSFIHEQLLSRAKTFGFRRASSLEQLPPRPSIAPSTSSAKGLHAWSLPDGFVSPIGCTFLGSHSMERRAKSLNAASNRLIEIAGALADENLAGRNEFGADAAQLFSFRPSGFLLFKTDSDLPDRVGMPVEPKPHTPLQISAKSLHQVHTARTDFDFHVSFLRCIGTIRA